MKKYISVLGAAVLVMFAACQKEKVATSNVALTATLEQQVDNGATKTALGTGNTVVWSEGDQIKVHGSTGVEELTLTAGAGTTTGSFGTTTVNAPDYAIYPSSAYTSIAGSTITFNLPATQTYAANSFGNGANVAVAKIEGGNMAFKNVCGALKLQLKGSMKVAKIELTGKNNEKLNGAFTVDAAASPFVGAVKSGEPSDAEKKVTLDCSHFNETSGLVNDGGVQLNSETAINFCIIVPIDALANGFDAIIYDVAGDTYKTTLSTSEDNTIERSVIVNMPSKAVSVLPVGYTESKFIQKKSSDMILISGSAKDDGTNDIVTFTSTYKFSNVTGRHLFGFSGSGVNHYTGINEGHPEIGTTKTGINTAVTLNKETIYTFKCSYKMSLTELWVYGAECQMLENGHHTNNAFLGKKESNFGIFGIPEYASFNLPANSIFYGASIYFTKGSTTTLAGRIIPCVRAIDSKVGVYNLMSDEFFEVSSEMFASGGSLID